MQWEINKKSPKKFLEQFPEYSRLTLQLLWDRNLKSQKQIDEFFSPDYCQDLYDPFLMKGVKKTVKRIKKALKNKEKIVIFGDFDADGVCSCAIMSNVLKLLGACLEIYIPDRNKEGYGLNKKAIQKLYSKGIKLIITVDCGSTDFEEIKLANKLGIDTIIVDHHLMPNKAPLAYSIVNPKQKGENYPFKYLAAVGVVFKVAQALLRDIKNQAKEGWEKWLLDLVAIATVTDSMPLIGENRTLVKYGLVVLAKTKRPGLKKLMEISGIKPFVDSDLVTNLNVYTLGYVIGPRLNAAGRMGNANLAYDLLVVKSKKKAEELAQKLDIKNKERQKLTREIVKEVDDRIKIGKNKLIFEGDKKWHMGIVGIIASRLLDKYFKPVVLFQKLKEKSKGSARSIPGFNIVEAFSECKDFLEDYGGHPQAAGFTVKNENLDKFKEKLFKIANKKIRKKTLIPKLKIDSELKPEELNFNLYKEIERFSPFGKENFRPLFLMRDCQILYLKKVGKNNDHLKIYLMKNKKKFKAIGFNLGHFCDKVKKEDKIDIVFELITNEWNGTKELELKIIDLKIL